MNSRQPLIPNRGLGKQLCELLRKELAIPERCREFTVRFAVDDIVTVNCTYMPTEGRPADKSDGGAVFDTTQVGDMIASAVRVG